MTDNTPQNPEAFSETPLENNHTNPQFEHLQYAWGDAALRGIAAAGCGRSDRQLNTFDYLADVPGNLDTTDFVEVQFKTRERVFTATTTICRSKKATSWPSKHSQVTILASLR